MAIFYTDTGSFNQIEVTGSTILSGSLIVSGTTNFGPSGLTGSLFGTASWANNVISSSFATSASFAPTILPNNVVSSSAQVTALLPTGTVSSSAQINTGSFTGSFVGNITSSHVQLNGLTDTTQTNKVLVLDTATNKIFTTASVGGGGGSGPAFPFSGSAVITGSLLVTGSQLSVSGTLRANTASFGDVTTGFASNGKLTFGSDASVNIQRTPLISELTLNAQRVVIGNGGGLITVDTDAGTIQIDGAISNGLTVQGAVFATTFTSSISNNVGYLGTASVATFAPTASLAQTTSTGIAVTGSFSGSLLNITEMSMAVSGAITASGTVGVQLNLNSANYFTVSASGTGTVTWTLINPPPAGRAQTFIIEYTNGGIKTNTWFTNTRWPAGVAPSLTSASANPDLLGFTTDDAGANWRGVLLQRGSA